jgi:ubiquinol-cytochrome c reductase cytochrome b subunit
MLPHGEFVEVHEELTPEKKWLLTQHEQNAPIELEVTDKTGVRNPKGIRAKLQAKFSASNAEAVAKPTAQDIKQLESGHH